MLYSQLDFTKLDTTDVKGQVTALGTFLDSVKDKTLTDTEIESMRLDMSNMVQALDAQAQLINNNIENIETYIVDNNAQIATLTSRISVDLQDALNGQNAHSQRQKTDNDFANDLFGGNN